MTGVDIFQTWATVELKWKQQSRKMEAGQTSSQMLRRLRLV